MTKRDLGLISLRVAYSVFTLFYFYFFVSWLVFKVKAINKVFM